MIYEPYRLPEDYHSAYRRHYNEKRDGLVRRKAREDAERDFMLDKKREKFNE